MLKPGGHILCFAGTRTQHRMAVNIEAAGFEIRDMLSWVYGSGFPKSLNVSKAIDKSAGAKQWEGWGTGLKPAFEPITLARKPLSEKTIAKNVLKWGTGGINIDGCRVGLEGGTFNTKAKRKNKYKIAYGDGLGQQGGKKMKENKGRFPTNFIHDGSDEVLELFPETKSAGKARTAEEGTHGGKSGMFWIGGPAMRHGDNGGSAARFFYSPKASRKDRDEGMEGMEYKTKVFNGGSVSSSKDIKPVEKKFTTKLKNIHPTVKPTELMRYLVRLITPENGIVLDPYMGSGSTGKACKMEGFHFFGIEKNEEYFEIAKARVCR